MRLLRNLATSQRRALASASLATGTGVAFLICVPPALAPIQRELAIPFEEVQWITGAYLLPQAALLFVAGSLGDRVGHRRLFLSGTGGFTVAAALAGFSPSGSALILGAAAAGCFSALAIGNALTIIAFAFADARRKAPLPAGG